MRDKPDKVFIEVITITITVRKHLTYAQKLTNQRGSYAFSFNPFTVHVRRLLPTSDIEHVLWL